MVPDHRGPEHLCSSVGLEYDGRRLYLWSDGSALLLISFVTLGELLKFFKTKFFSSVKYNSYLTMLSRGLSKIIY